MTEDEIFKEAEIHFGPKFNRAHVAAFAATMINHGIRQGSDMTRASYKEMNLILKTSAHKHCRGCDGTGIFYGNVGICPCTYGTVDTDALVDRLAKASMLHALFVGADRGHRDHMVACGEALNKYRVEFECPGVRYWWHDESDCLVTTFTDEEVEALHRGPEELLEITRMEAQVRLKRQLEKRVEGNSAESTALPEDDEEL